MQELLPITIQIAKRPKKNALVFASVFFPMIFGVTFLIDSSISYKWWIALLVLVSGISLIVWIYKQQQRNFRKIELSTEGIRQIDGNGKEVFIDWNEPHQTYYSGTQFSYYGVIPLGSVLSAQVVAKGKKILALETPVKTFYPALLKLSYEAQLKWCQDELSKGNRIYFGPVEMDKFKIYFKKKETWIEEIKNVKVFNGKVQLKLEREWFSTHLEVSEIPNVTVFLSLLKLENYHSEDLLVTGTAT